MNLHAILIIDLVGLVFTAWVLNLVRNGRLDLGYGLVWLTGATGAILLVTVAPLRRGLTRAVGAVFPASALALVAFLFIFVVLVILTVQMSALIRRQGELVKAVARQRLGEDGRRGGVHGEQDAEQHATPAEQNDALDG